MRKMCIVGDSPVKKFVALMRAVLRTTRASDWDTEFTATVLSEIRHLNQRLSQLRFTCPRCYGYLDVGEACVDGLAAANGDAVPHEVATALRKLVLRVLITMPDGEQFAWQMKRAHHGFRFEAVYMPPGRTDRREVNLTFEAVHMPRDVLRACALYFGRGRPHPANLIAQVPAEA